MKKPLRRFAAALRGMKLVYKLLLSYALLILLSLGAFSLILYWDVSGIVRANAEYSQEQAYEQAHSYLSYKLYNIKKTSNLFTTNKELLELLARDDSDYSVAEQLLDANRLDRKSVV